jgi:hypothetical protein
LYHWLYIVAVTGRPTVFAELGRSEEGYRIVYCKSEKKMQCDKMDIEVEAECGVYSSLSDRH